jgi:pyridoxal phosphate enzyme (YggS family)
VSKTFDAAHVRAAADAGQADFGENRVQEGLDKISQLAHAAPGPLVWHLIGSLQSNKARKAAAAFAWIHSIDRVDLVRKLDAAAAEQGTRPQVLVQVNLAQEASKHGADEDAAEALVAAALSASSLDLRGLMTVPPFPATPEDSRPWFVRLRGLRDELVRRGLPADRLRELSMGMSHDFEIAIEEGATIVRVGTAIFGRRTPPAGPQP